MTAALLTLAVSVWAARRPDGLDVLVSIVDVGALAAFTLLHASVVGYFLTQRRGVVRVAHYVVPVLGAAVTLWVIAEASPLAQMVGGLWTVAALVILAVGRGRPASEVLP